jgi:hypothetical protein
MQEEAVSESKEGKQRRRGDERRHVGFETNKIEECGNNRTGNGQPINVNSRCPCLYLSYKRTKKALLTSTRELHEDVECITSRLIWPGGDRLPVRQLMNSSLISVNCELSKRIFIVSSFPATSTGKIAASPLMRQRS